MDGAITANGIRAAADDAAESRARISLIVFAIVAVQLGLVLVLLRQFQIESTAFIQLAAVVFVAFAVHAFLPLRMRLPFFSLLSIASLPLALGLVNGIWLLAIGSVLIAICHLPVSFRWRAAGLLLVVVCRRATRDCCRSWSEAIRSILGSMFMFR
jgi:hypothetical protein